MPETSSDTAVEQRQDTGNFPSLAGVQVREDDVESVRLIRAVVYLFRGMGILLLLLAAIQVFSAVTSTVELSIGVVAAEVVRLVIFAGLLWGGGDLAVLWIKSHYDIRATRILVARIAYMTRKMGEAGGTLPRADQTSRANRET
ncbi:hypothetical protein BH11GEM1_BH11GEM1_09860 [soil metagenome]